jgi:sulfotransferase
MSDLQQKQFMLLSGLPRAGSTLLVALLTQNPLIYGEGASALCQIMWNAKQACDTNALAANNRLHTKHDILSALPSLYYKEVDQPIIIEKGRTWPQPANFNMWKEYINAEQKMVVLIRPIDQIVRSLVSLRQRNGWTGDLWSDLLAPDSEPIMKAFGAIYLAQQHPTANILFVDYRDLIADPASTLHKIYNHYEWRHFDHWFDGISQKRIENDEVHGLIGMHEIRETISPRSIDVDLPDRMMRACEELNALLYGAIRCGTLQQREIAPC